MHKSVFGYIIAHSKWQQMFILAVTMASFPFLYLTFELPKLIINDALALDRDIAGADFPRTVLGVDVDQTGYLLLLSVVFLAIVLINGGFKYYINLYRGALAERLIRRLRYELLEAVTRFPLPHVRTMSQGEVVSMVTAETEPLGGYMGNAVAVPVFQGGTLITLLAFMVVQDWVLGLAAIALYPLQGWLIPKLQNIVNQLNKERTIHVRRTSERIGELVGGVAEIHNHDTARFELAELGKQLGKIYRVRWYIYRAKFLIKFTNNFMAQITPFFFYSIGGYLVIVGRLDLGAMVAVLAAYKDLSAPWKLLLQHYQQMADARIRHDQLVSRFQPPGMLPPPEPDPATPAAAPPPLDGTVAIRDLVLEDEVGTRVIDGASAGFDLTDHVAFIGSGAADLARLLGRRAVPSAGSVTIDGRALAGLPLAQTGRDLAYVDADAFLRSGSVRDTLLYGIKHRPLDDPAAPPDDPAVAAARREAIRAGNSPHSPDGRWIDPAAMGLGAPGQIPARLAAVLRCVGLEDDLLQIGLQQVVTPDTHPALAEAIVAARAGVRDRLATAAFAGLVELFDRDRFIHNTTLAENILFGTPTDATVAPETLAARPDLVRALDAAGATGPLLAIGIHCARITGEMVRDLTPGHAAFDRFGFIRADDLVPLRRVLPRIAADDSDALRPDDRTWLLSLALRLQPAKHRLAIIDADLQARLLDARRRVTAALPADRAIAVFDPAAYNPASTIQDNILFGKVVSGRADSTRQVADLLTTVITDHGLRDDILAVGLDVETGIAGRRLSTAQRQQLALARCLVKRPRLLIVNGGLSSLDDRTRHRILDALHDEQAGRGLVWVDKQVQGDSRFQRVFLIENGGIHDPAAQHDPEARHAPEARTATGPRPVAPPAAGPHPAGAGGPGGDIDRLTDRLAAVPLLDGIDRGRLKLLAFGADIETHSGGQTLYREGDTGDAGYVILDGAVALSVETRGRHRRIGVRGPGDMLSELTLLSGTPRLETAETRGPVRLLRLTESDVGAILDANIETSRMMTRRIADRLAAATRRLTGGDRLYDDASGLPTRDLLRDRMQLVMSQGARDSVVSALVVLSLAGLDPARQAGWRVSESVLARQVADRLRRCLRNADTLARLDLCRFGIIANASSRSTGVDIAVVIRRLADALAEPLAVAGAAFPIADALDFRHCPLTPERAGDAEALIIGDPAEPVRHSA